MSELRDLYQEVILDHVKRPRNSGALAGASHRADGDNPLCGDKVTIFLSIEDGRIADEGSFADLKNRSALFNELWKHQEKG